MHKVLDFTTKAAYARRLSALALEHAIRDCRACIAENIDPDYYRDEISVYQQEIKRREKHRENKWSLCRVAGEIRVTSESFRTFQRNDGHGIIIVRMFRAPDPPLDKEMLAKLEAQAMQGPRVFLTNEEGHLTLEVEYVPQN